MLKIFTTSPGGNPLTADITTITADTIDITADATQTGITSSTTLKVPYRVFESDVNLFLINELSQLETVIPLTATDLTGSLEVTFTFSFFEGDSYESYILQKVTNKLLWRGRIYTTDQINDLQNFTLVDEDGDGIIRI